MTVHFLIFSLLISVPQKKSLSTPFAIYSVSTLYFYTKVILLNFFFIFSYF